MLPGLWREISTAKLLNSIRIVFLEEGHTAGGHLAGGGGGSDDHRPEP